VSVISCQKSIYCFGTPEYKDREHSLVLPEEVFGSGNRYVKKIFLPIILLLTAHYLSDRKLITRKNSILQTQKIHANMITYLNGHIQN